MKKAIIFAVILIMSCAMLQLASCNTSPIEVSDNGDICEYEGQKYVCILNSDWKLKLQPSQVKKIGVHQGKAYSLDDVFITLESVPEVVIIDYNKYQSQIDLNFCLPYIRERHTLWMMFLSLLSRFPRWLSLITININHRSI